MFASAADLFDSARAVPGWRRAKKHLVTAIQPPKGSHYANRLKVVRLAADELGVLDKSMKQRFKARHRCFPADVKVPPKWYGLPAETCKQADCLYCRAREAERLLAALLLL